jgi:hypothetical protein
MSMNCIFNGYSVATSADGIPLDTFTPAAANTIVYLVAAWGLAQLALSLIAVLVLIRYRTAIPFMFALFLAELLSRKPIHYFIPTVRVGTPPAPYVNFVLLTLMCAGLALSLWSRHQEAAT